MITRSLLLKGKKEKTHGVKNRKYTQGEANKNRKYTAGDAKKSRNHTSGDAE